jgi:membrane-associated protease RseP (regulator of RpoE activity)
MPPRSRLSRPFKAFFLLAAGLGFIFRIAGAYAVEIPESSRTQAQDAAKALGSDNFSERSNAKEQLLRLGRASIEPLEYAVKSEDPEVRLRAMEILIALRGRGFLGIGLQESADDELVDLDAAPEEDAKDAVRTVTPPVVSANQIVSFRQPPYNTYGLTRPFPAEAAGMQPGDKILSINERPIHGVKDLMREVITIGPARTAIIVIERGAQKLRLPVLLTRNPMTTRGNDFGGYQMVRDGSPPVDLEKELDGGNAEPDKRAELPDLNQRPNGAGGVQIINGGQIIGGGQVFIQGQARVIIQAQAAGGAQAEVKVQINGVDVAPKPAK